MVQYNQCHKLKSLDKSELCFTEYIVLDPDQNVNKCTNEFYCRGEVCEARGGVSFCQETVESEKH